MATIKPAMKPILTFNYSRLSKTEMTLTDKATGTVVYTITKPKHRKPFSTKDKILVLREPNRTVVGEGHLHTMSNKRDLVWPETGKAVKYYSSFNSEQGNAAEAGGEMIWHLVSSYMKKDTKAEVELHDKEDNVILRIDYKGGLEAEQGRVEVYQHAGTQESLEEILLTAVVEILDPKGKQISALDEFPADVEDETSIFLGKPKLH